MTLVGVEEVAVPAKVLADTETSLRAAGRRGHELFVLWTGHVEARVFEVADAHVPRQVAYRSERGCGVRVDGAELYGLNAWLYDQGQRLGVQIHSHPEDAFHSDTDDTFPIVTAEGGISIVAARFGRDGLLSTSTATYRLTRDGWTASPPLVRLADR